MVDAAVEAIEEAVKLVVGDEVAMVVVVVLLCRGVRLFEEEVVVVVAVVAMEPKSKVVESTANSVGEPTKSKAIDEEALEPGPAEPFEFAVEETEVAKMLLL